MSKRNKNNYDNKPEVNADIINESVEEEVIPTETVVDENNENQIETPETLDSTTGSTDEVVPTPEIIPETVPVEEEVIPTETDEPELVEVDSDEVVHVTEYTEPVKEPVNTNESERSLIEIFLPVVKIDIVKDKLSKKGINRVVKSSNKIYVECNKSDVRKTIKLITASGFRGKEIK